MFGRGFAFFVCVHQESCVDKFVCTLNPVLTKFWKIS